MFGKMFKRFIASVLVATAVFSLAESLDGGEFTSPFLKESNQVPSYMLEVYRQVANPKRKICHDRTFVSLPNLIDSSSSICSPGRLSFSLYEENEIGRYLHSGRVFIEIKSARRKRPKVPRKVVVALSFKGNDTLLGHKTIKVNSYGAIDITKETRKWWSEKAYDAPDMDIHFYIVYPKGSVKSCSDIFWRVSTLAIWQDKRRCKKRLRKPRHNTFVNSTSVFGSDSSDETDLQDEDEMLHSKEDLFPTVHDLEKAFDQSVGLREVLKRSKRSVNPVVSSKTIFANQMNEQKRIFLGSLNRRDSRNSTKEEKKKNTFLEILLRHLIKTNILSKSLKPKTIRNQKKSFRKGKKTKVPVAYSSARVGRNPRKTAKNSLKSRKCSLKRGIINFHKINFDWVIAPKQYSSGRCIGQCDFPIDASVNPSGYALLSAVKRHVTGKGRKPCCVPDKMESLTLLFKNTNGQLLVKNFDDMVVKSCRCW